LVRSLHAEAGALSVFNGVLVVDKPQGPTSFDVVHKVRAALKTKKVGHTGTLDPMATGVLPICLGDATRIAQFITEKDKDYEAQLRLGVTTDTLDAEGKVLLERPVPTITRELLEAALSKFRGTFLQTPPMYSAVKVGGKRLYELAREGKEVERAAREVTVHALTLVDFSAEQVRLKVSSSKGFFVRTLAADLGEALGCGAHLTALRRTRSGTFSLSQALTLDKVLLLGPDGVRERLVSPDEALRELPVVTLQEADATRVRHGVQVELAVGVATEGATVRVHAPGALLLAIADVQRGRLVYRRVLA
jgi:tRNA pseudouridine55 synthase